MSERKLWDKYLDCYEDAINKTSQPHAPWFVIPADDKDFSRYIVAKILLEEMSKYTNITEPQADESILKNIDHYKERLARKDV
jgi:hypothetical protein